MECPYFKTKKKLGSRPCPKAGFPIFPGMRFFYPFRCLLPAVSQRRRNGATTPAISRNPFRCKVFTVSPRKCGACSFREQHLTVAGLSFPGAIPACFQERYVERVKEPPNIQLRPLLNNQATKASPNAVIESSANPFYKWSFSIWLRCLAACHVHSRILLTCVSAVMPISLSPKFVP